MADVAVGQTFGQLTIVSLIPADYPNRALVRCGACGRERLLQLVTWERGAARCDVNCVQRVSREPLPPRQAAAPEPTLAVGQVIEGWTVEKLMPHRVFVRCGACGARDLFRLPVFLRGRVPCWMCWRKVHTRVPGFKRLSPGERHGRWTVVEDRRQSAVARDVLCRCRCGALRTQFANALRQGGAKRCQACQQQQREQAAAKQAQVRQQVRQRELERAGAAREQQREQATALRLQRLRDRALDAASANALAAPATRDELAPQLAPQLPPRTRPVARNAHFITGVGTDARHDQGYFSCEVHESYDAAVEFLATGNELTKLQRVQLQRDGIVRLRGAADGAAYLEITKCTCKTPHVHSDSGVRLEAAE